MPRMPQLTLNDYRVRDLWEHKDLGIADALSLQLPSHASVLYSVLENK